MTDILMQLKVERRWTLVFLVLALGLVGVIQGWVSSQSVPELMMDSSVEGTL